MGPNRRLSGESRLICHAQWAVMQKLLIIASALFWSILMVGSVAAQTAVTTYHYDNLRTGWNQNETLLTATNFPNNFGLLQTVELDDQVDA